MQQSHLANKAIGLADHQFQFAHLTLAAIYFNDGQLDKARQLFTQATKIFPNGGAKNYLAFYWLGVVQFAQGDVEVALSSFRRSVESKAGFRPAWEAIEKVSHYQMAGGNRATASAVLEELLSAK